MTFAELKAEVEDRGFDYVKSSRIGLYVENAYQSICAKYPWYFLEKTVEGTAPIEIADVGHVLAVEDTRIEATLRGVTRDWLISTYAKLSLTGSPEFYYLEEKTLKTYPVNESDTLSIHYMRVPTELTTETSEPLIPKAWQYLIVEQAVVNCLRDNDEFAEARALQADVNSQIQEMIHALTHRNYSNPQLIWRSGYPQDYLY